MALVGSSLKNIVRMNLVLVMLLFGASLQAQEKPPIPIEVQVNTSRFLNFGSFTTGTNGGTVTVDYTGERVASGDVVLMNMGPTVSSAQFEVTANPGTIVNIAPPTGIILTGSNGGTMTLNIDSFSTGQTFITTGAPPATTTVFVGGTLTVGNNSVSQPGFYEGTFNLTFIQE